MRTKEFIEESVQEWLGLNSPGADEMGFIVDLVDFCIRKWCPWWKLEGGEERPKVCPTWKERMDECEGGLRGPIPSDSTRARVEQWQAETCYVCSQCDKDPKVCPKAVALDEAYKAMRHNNRGRRIMEKE